ncbi:MAG: hypothetical protein ACJZ14_02930 [Candidatus Neomarinimicrobiota bacterium]
MKQFASIILFIYSFLWSKNDHNDVQHIIVKYNGESIVGYIDSIGYDLLYYTPKDSADIDSMHLRHVYYAYNNYKKIFHYSWSFMENIRMMVDRPATLFTSKGDTILLNKVRFRPDMLQPEVFIQDTSYKSELISLFDIEKINTDYSIMEFSVKRGFFYSFYSFLIVTALNTILNMEDGRKIPQIWNQFNELLPRLSLVGLRDTGKAYESLSFVIPTSVLLSMTYDVWKNKNEFYFSPLIEEKKFERNMYVFSFKHITKTQLSRIVYKIESTNLGNKLVRLFR